MNKSKSHVKCMTACRAPEDDYISRQEAIDVCMKYNGQGYVWSCIMGDLRKLPSVQPEACDTCKHGYFGDEQCNDCRVRFTSHYERRTDVKADKGASR